MRTFTRTSGGLALLAVAALLLPACGPGDSGALGDVPTAPAVAPSVASPATHPAPPARPGPPAAPAPSPPDPVGAPPPASRLDLELWFTREGKLFPTRRAVPSTVATSRATLRELAAGPTTVEAAAGLRTGLDPGMSFSVSISGGVATVDLPGSFYAGGRDAARLRQAQVVYSLTQFPTVSTVGFQQSGEALGAPVARADYEDLLPAIVVTSVAIGQRVSSPVTVAGTANVFEATVSIRILDADGDPVATTFTTATCGSGCRGEYSVAVSYRSSSEQPGRLQVYEVSAKDGSRINVVDIPVTLAAAG